MTQPATIKTLADQLVFLAQTLGPILPLWGIDLTTKTCLCPDGSGCKQSPGKHPYSKLAPNGFYSATTDEKTIRGWVARNPDGNWALRTGQELPFGGYLIVVDVDEHNAEVSGRDTMVQLEATHGKLPDTVRAITGGGGDHYFFRSPTQFSGRTLALAVDLKATGGYVAIAPSLHVSGARYEWDAACDPEDVQIADAPDWVVGGATKSNPRPQWNKSSAKDTLLGAAFDAAGRLGDEQDEGKWAVDCPQSHLHTDGRGKGKDSSSVILPAIEGTSFGSFICSHSHCLSLKWDDIIRLLPPDAYQKAKMKYPLKPKLVKQAPTVVAPSTAIQRAAPDILTLFKYKTSASGNSTIIPDAVNMQTMLQYDPEWIEVLQFDEFSQQVKFTRDPPWFPDDKPAQQNYVWVDKDLMRAMNFAMRKYDMSIKENQAYAAVQLAAERNAVHPVREYLNGLVWDGRPRVDNWCARYLGSKNDTYTQLVGRWWLISCVARVMKPGCKADHVLILEGKQGINKSTALGALAVRREWFSDTPFEIGNKDGYMLLRGKWIVELAELDSLTRAESSKAKAFFSSPEDTYRAPYGREMVSIPRQCAFAGTVNLDQYLKDNTGNRRYWPVACDVINIVAIISDRDQIWAEAVHLYNAGAAWWPTTSQEIALCAGEQDARGDSDVWLQPVAEWLTTVEALELYRKNGGGIRVDEILARALLMEAGRQNKNDQMRIGNIMRELGYTRKQMMRNCQRFTGYYK